MASLKKRYQEMKRVRFMERRIVAQDKTILKHLETYNKLQALVREDNFLQLTDVTTSYKGNQYNSYGAAIAEIDNKYNGTAKWGVAQTGIIVDTRAAFIIGEGIEV